MQGVRGLSINKRKNYLLKGIGVALFILIIFILNLFVSPLRNFFYNISAPLQKVFWNAGGSSSTFLGSLLSGVSLSRENESLKQQNQQLLSEVAFLRSIQQGNQAQSDVSTACQNSGFKLVMAGVVGLSSDDILSLNKGSADGIGVGMPVISQQGALFGKIFKVNKNFSDVLLISNASSVVDVKVQQADVTASEIDGVIKGKGRLEAYLDSVQIQDNISPGDILSTSSLDKTFPKDLLVGRIEAVQKDDQKPFQQGGISLFLNVKTAENLFVITNFKQAK